MQYANLVDLCRTLRVQLGAGVSPMKIWRQLAEKGPQPFRSNAERVCAKIQAGESLHQALSAEPLPTLLLAMIEVGEETGHLPEVLKTLEKYYLEQKQERSKFLSRIMLPAIQFVLAILLMAGLIWVLGMIGDSRRAKPMSLFGLSGGSGAMIFLAIVASVFTGLFMATKIARGAAAKNASFDRWILNLPGVGAYVLAAMLARLSLALQMTLDSGLSLKRGLVLSFAAAGNRVIEEQGAKAIAQVKKGKTLTEALAYVDLLPEEYREIIASAELAGSVPEAMRHQAVYYQEESSRLLTGLMRTATGIIWGVYALFMIWAIFSIASHYLNSLGV